MEPTPKEVEYLCTAFAQHFPGRSTRVLDSWAGLRVLPSGSGRAFERPRETTLVVNDARAPSLVAIYGGKLTGCRATVAKVVERLRPTLPARPERGRTDELPLMPDEPTA